VISSAYQRSVPPALVATDGKPTKLELVRHAAHTVSLGGYRSARPVGPDLGDRHLEPPLFRVAIRNLYPTFVLAIAGHVTVQNDSMARSLTEGDVNESTLGDRLDDIERSAMTFVIANEQMGGLVLDRENLSGSAFDHEVRTTAETEGMVDQGSIRRAISGVEMHLGVSEQDREISFAVVLVDEPVVRRHVHPSVLDDNAEVGWWKEGRVPERNHVRRGPSFHWPSGDDRSVMDVEELHLVRAPRIGHEVVRAHVFRRGQLRFRGHRQA
jgi:hypothetical protein